MMNSTVDVLVDKLLEVLDSDVTHLEMSLVALDQLRAAVIKRDESSLKKLLSVIQTELSAYENIERQRDVIRAEIARVLGCVDKELNLSKLQDFVEDQRRDMLFEKQEILRGLVDKLKTEHASTVLFLQECTRLNNRLIKSVFGKRKQLTYNRMGKSDWQGMAGVATMMNMKF